MSQQLLEDPWRAVCPNGHNGWTPNADGSYYCSVCGPFDELHDAAEIDRPAAPAYR